MQTVQPKKSLAKPLAPQSLLPQSTSGQLLPATVDEDISLDELPGIAADGDGVTDELTVEMGGFVKGTDVGGRALRVDRSTQTL